MRRRSGAGVLLLAAALCAPATAWSAAPISIADDFTNGIDPADWKGPQANVTTDAAKGLVLAAGGAVGSVSTEPLTNKKPDLLATAVIDLDPDKWAGRSITIRIQRDEDPDKVVVFARVTAFRDSRTAAETHYRLFVGLVGQAPGTTDAPDDSSVKKLELRLEGNAATARLLDGADSEIATVAVTLPDAGTNVTLVRLGIQADPVLASPAVGSFNADSLN